MNVTIDKISTSIYMFLVLFDISNLYPCLWNLNHFNYCLHIGP